jgi:hypothetical protein
MAAERNPAWRQLRAPLHLTSARAARSISSRASEECFRINRRVGGFDWTKSYAWIELAERYGPKLVHAELVSIADLAASRLHIKLDRDARRRKVVMLKWFEENWALIRPLLEEIELYT